MLTRRALLGTGLAAGVTALSGSAPVRAGGPPLADPTAPAWRLPVADAGPVIRHGNTWDAGGCREPIAYADPDQPGRLWAHYDGCTTPGWLACLAVSDDDGQTWVKKGRRLKLGPAGSRFDASASSPWVLPDPQAIGTARAWRMFYLGAAAASARPDCVPIAPYWTLTAAAPGPGGPWDQSLPAPVFRTGSGGCWTSGVPSPGSVVRHGGWWWMYWSASVLLPDGSHGWGVGLARALTLDGPWTQLPGPVIPPSERAENATVWQDPASSRWWLFTNHLGHETDPATGKVGYYGAAVWAYWSDDAVSGWNTADKALVIDRAAAPWATGAIGMASVVPAGDGRLAVLYDANPAGDRGHMGRDVGLAWADLPLAPVPA